jgi:peptidoglycan/LPS O-acetylase OafA/YrhL
LQGKQIALETLRGLAALVVVGWHLTLAFDPVRAGILVGAAADHAYNGRFWFGLLNGPAAVEFFFVLSGFVLTRRALATGDLGVILRGTAKRWPRLAGPVLVTVVGAWLLIALGFPAYAPAADVTGSPWLASFGNALGSGDAFVPSLGDALLQGTVGTFLFGDISYDSSLWTMQLEFFGSFLAFLLAIVLIMLRATPHWVKGLAALMGVVLAMHMHPAMIGFPIGVWLAWHILDRPPALSFRDALICCVVGMWLAGWSTGYGAIALVGQWTGVVFPAELAHAIGAALIILAVQGCDRLARNLSGRAAGWLGRLSFPIYLVHVPILCSAGCAGFVAVHRVLPAPGPAITAVVITVTLTLAAAVPLAGFDAWWTRWLSAYFAGWFASSGHEGARVSAVHPNR